MTRHSGLVPIDASVGDGGVTAEKGKWTWVNTGAPAKPLQFIGSGVGSMKTHQCACLLTFCPCGRPAKAGVQGCDQ